ncbi:bacterial alpha-L-rhamnosidase domain-containing protein [Pterulicium gracile]|uniref:Bacterial alpha-L-rhamnosidase domain-containing protein n=1 Tax=Pterulicium gracile TaxID=1884261 RepID=A0A5C3QPF8_9AGAR|nr:bacterial alpha-L-rhamnosidase domain-containing protein [Pterula gracilis]
MTELPEHHKVSHVPATRLNAAFAQKAEDLLPTLHNWNVSPIGTVTFEPDESEYFKRRKRPQFTTAELQDKAWGKGQEFILDFGDHHVGYLKFRLTAQGPNVDAPARLRLTMGETPPDVTEELHPCKSWISTSWIPDEVVNIDYMPKDFALHRRHAFRYVRVQVLDTSAKYQVKFSVIHIEAVSAVTAEQVLALPPFPFNDDTLCRIDAVSMTTLRNCMQTVFEDGPRRDRRLWSGDLRLQALTNYCTFRNNDLVKRCLYLFAALVREDDSTPACLFEKPVLTPASDYIVDYDILFGSTAHDYAVQTGDLETAEELWETVLGSTKGALAHVEDGVFRGEATQAWKFLDWAENLEKDAGMHGAVIVGLKAVDSLAKLLKKPPPYEDVVAEMISKAERAFYDAEQGVFVSGKARQVSWASQAWLALAGVMDAGRLKSALVTTMHDPNALKPLTPYLYHHFAEALCNVGGEEECLQLIRTYWGGMISAGADTFWECFDADDYTSSPYGDHHNHSFCHAWSCTPSYLLRVKLRDWLADRKGL